MIPAGIAEDGVWEFLLLLLLLSRWVLEVRSGPSPKAAFDIARIPQWALRSTSEAVYGAVEMSLQRFLTVGVDSFGIPHLQRVMLSNRQISIRPWLRPMRKISKG